MNTDEVRLIKKFKIYDLRGSRSHPKDEFECGICGKTVKISELNRGLRYGKYLQGRKCNACYNKACKFSLVKSTLVRALTRLGIEDDKIIEILKDEWKRVFKDVPIPEKGKTMVEFGPERSGCSKSIIEEEKN